MVSIQDKTLKVATNFIASSHQYNNGSQCFKIFDAVNLYRPGSMDFPLSNRLSSYFNHPQLKFVFEIRVLKFQ